MKVLVTGAHGQLGGKLREVLAPHFSLLPADLPELDITDEACVRDLFARERPGAVIHAAAYTAVDRAEEDRERCFRVNANGTEIIARAAAGGEIPLIYLSTDYVFDGVKRTAYTEEDQPNPLSVYGESKLRGEEKVRAVCPAHYILRVAWLFGELPAASRGTNFVETMLRLASQRPALAVVADQIGSPTYTGDLAGVIKTLLQAIQQKAALPAGAYHFSGEGETSWYAFAAEIFRRAGVSVNLAPIETRQYPQKAKRPPYSYLDKSKIKHTLGIQVRAWQDMLEEYLKRR